MQVFAILLPALFVAISVGKIMMHTQEILFVQAFKTDLKRIFYHRNRRLSHSFAKTFRQVIRTDALLEAAQSGDEEAGERVLRENTGLIWSVVRRYNGRGVETEDLYQLGCIGFLKAVKGFDLTYGTQFST